MQLTQAQIQEFNDQGYLFFPGLFKPAEVKGLTDTVPELYARREALNVREKDSDAVRTNFAAHMYSEPFARLGRHPRMIKPVEQLFNEKLYMHQFKINGKMAFEGDVWQWHQDYGTWLNFCIFFTMSCVKHFWSMKCWINCSHHTNDNSGST